MKLQEWAIQNVPSKKMLWYEAYWNQIKFVRDTLIEVFSNDDYEYYKFLQDSCCVVSTHTSKSIKLPVYQIKLLDDTTFIMRDNFYDWKVSVKSEKEININNCGLFNEKETITECYCEGFIKDWIYSNYSQNKKKFTVEIRNNYDLYVFMFLINQWLNR